MTDQAFNEMVLLLRRKWTRKQGALIRLQRAEDDSSPLLLCVGAMLNQGFRAENCRVWDGNKLAYVGPLESQALQQLLTDKQTCFGELNTAAKLDVKEGPCYCFGDPTDCSKQCQLRRQHAEPESV